MGGELGGELGAEADQSGCVGCGGRGRFEVSCPMRFVEGCTWELLQMASFWKQGLPPAAGGFLEQTESVIRGCEFVWGERERVKRELTPEVWERE